MCHAGLYKQAVAFFFKPDCTFVSIVDLLVRLHSGVLSLLVDLGHGKGCDKR